MRMIINLYAFLISRFEPVLKDEPWFNLEKLKKCKTVRDFDRYVTAPQFGFKSDLEYYQEASSTKDLHKLLIPIYALNAIDDPMQLEKCKLKLNFKANHIKTIQ